MCGRITQYRCRAEYASALGWPEDHRKWLGDTNPAYNVAPGTSPWVMHHLKEDQADDIDQIHWGYRPAWAAEKGIPMAINARIEKAATGRYFRHMWKSGRVIVPADGWYEWTGEKGHKQPWYIRLTANWRRKMRSYGSILICLPSKRNTWRGICHSGRMHLSGTKSVRR